MHKIVLSPSAQKFLKKADSILYERLIKKLKALAENPFPADVKRVIGRKDKVFRVRVGSYRITYVVYSENNEVLISDIDKRPRIY